MTLHAYHTVIIFFNFRLIASTIPVLTHNPEESFINLIKEHQGLIHKVCILYETDRDTRNDLFQEIVLQLWKSFHTFRGDSKITTWMYRIALNTAISGLRKYKRTLTTEELEERHFNISDSYSDDHEENLETLHRCIRQLTEIERAMIMMALDEVPYEEIAETIGITQNNVRVRMNRIREKLRKMMNT